MRDESTTSGGRWVGLPSQSDAFAWGVVRLERRSEASETAGSKLCASGVARTPSAACGYPPMTGTTGSLPAVSCSLVGKLTS